MYGQRDMFGALADPVKCGLREVELWSIGARRTMKAQDEHPEKFYNVRFDDLVRDPIGVVRGCIRGWGSRWSRRSSKRCGNGLTRMRRRSRGSIATGRRISA